MCHDLILSCKLFNFQRSLIQIFTKDELANASLEDVYSKIKTNLTYDEYKWQYENEIKILTPNRAEGLELVLYQCPHCEVEFQICSESADLFCKNCNSKWYMTELGKMEIFNYDNKEPQSKKAIHIPDWYEWQRLQVMSQIDSRDYSLEILVEVESLPNAKNFIPLGQGILKHKLDGFHLTVKDYGKEKEETLFFPAKSMMSVHTEYDYRSKGQCITLSTLDNTYFIYPTKSKIFNVTKIQFAAEYLYSLSEY